MALASGLTSSPGTDFLSEGTTAIISRPSPPIQRMADIRWSQWFTIGIHWLMNASMNLSIRT